MFIRYLGVVGGLEGPSALLGALGEGNTKLEELEDHGGEVLEEELLILGILVDPLSEALVSDKGHVGGKHHQGLGGLVLILLGCQSSSPGTRRKGHLPAWDRSTSSSSTSRSRGA